jgi:hypothetical protein
VEVVRQQALPVGSAHFYHCEKIGEKLNISPPMTLQKQKA